jgi:tetratricopeptide (TPR) repeat protein
MNFKLGVCYYNLKKFKEAIPYFATCIYKYRKIEITEKAAYLHYKAYENLYNERWNSPYIKAINFYLKNYPQHKFASDAHYRLGKYYGQKGRGLAAIKEFEKVSEESRYLVRSRFFIFQYRTEDFERVRVKTGKHITSAYRRATRARKNFLTAMREEDRDKLIDKDPERNNFMAHAALFSSRIWLHGPEKKYSQAIKELDKFERRYPSQRRLFLPVRILRIEAFQKLADFKKAGKEVEKLIQNYKKHPKVNDLLSVLAEQFTEETGKAKRSASGDGAIERSKIAILIYENLLPKSREKAQKEKLQYALGSLYLRVGNYQRASAIYQEILEKQPNSIRALKGLGEIYEREEKHKKALEYWRILEEKLRVGESAWYEAKYKIASTYVKLGNPQQACKILTVTRSLHPDLGGKEFKPKFLRLEEKVCSHKTQ